MADPVKELLIKVLQASAGATPLYPVEYSQTAGIERNMLDEALDRLRLAGLVRLTEWVKGKGQGYTTTPDGTIVLQNPGLIERPAKVVPSPLPGGADNRGAPWERGERVRRALIEPVKPIVTLTLLALNVIVFVLGLGFAWNAGVFDGFLSGGGQREVNVIRYYSGALDPLAVLGLGQWWRLITYAFVHIGFLHLLLNMMALYNLGPILETMWGHARFLYLYFLSALGGGCMILLGHSAAAGASGAISGMLASLGFWLILNRSHLPPELTSRWLNQVFLNVILLAFMSTFPGISWQGHLGGFVVGGVLSWPLNAQRFGAGKERLLALLGLVLLPVALAAGTWILTHGLP